MKRIILTVLLITLMLSSFVSAQNVSKDTKEDLLKDGLTAVEILQLADSNLKNKNTYKLKGIINMTINVKLPTGEEETAVVQMEQEGLFEAPETVYTISKGITNVNGEEIEQTVEVYMNEKTMYMRMAVDQEWIKVDLNPIMGQLESLMGSTQQGLPQFSSSQLEALGMYATYGEDIKIDEKDYYVVKVNIDAEAFKEMYNKIMEETFNIMFEGEMWEVMKKEQGVPEVMDEETFKATMKSAVEQLLQNMDLDMSQEYYINKESKLYSKLKLKQLVTMNLMGVETKVNMDGEYIYYDFGEEVVFPEVIYVEVN